MKIKEITLSGFRAYNQEYRFLFDDKLTLIIGENGTGKTSLFDGIQFSLLGKLSQYENIPEAKTEDMIINRSNPSGKLRVSVQLEGKEGETIEIERATKRGKKPLSPTKTVPYKVMQGKEPENEIEEITFDSFQSTVYLRQELIREFIHADPKKERRKAVSELLGIRSIEAILQGLDEAEKLLRKQSDHMNDDLSALLSQRDRVKEWQKNMEARKKGLKSKYELDNKDFELSSLVSLGIKLRNDLVDVTKTLDSEEDIPEAKEDFEGLDQFVSGIISIQKKIALEISDQVDENSGLFKELNQINEEIETSPAEEELKRELERCKVQIENNNNKLVELNRLDMLMVSAKEYLESTLSESCPVCENKIDPEKVAWTIGKRRSKDTTAIETIQKSMAELGLKKLELETQLNTLKRLQERKQEIESKSDRSKNAKAIDMKKKLDAIEGQIQKLSEILSYESSKMSLVVEAPSEEDISKTKEKQERLGNLVDAANGLNLAFGSAFPKLIDKKLRDLDPVVDKYARILTPHSIYSRILIKRDDEGNYWLKGASDEKETHVRTMFSTAQLNEVAIVLLLAMAEVSPYNLKFLILDDPSQSMDSEGKMKLSRLIAEVSQKRQVIIGTMDHEFAGYLQNLCKEARVYHFLGYTNESGPSVKP
jgi:exonuclease SbcC